MSGVLKQDLHASFRRIMLQSQCQSSMEEKANMDEAFLDPGQIIGMFASESLCPMQLGGRESKYG